MKLVLISDTHNRHDDLNLPEGDVLICSGDFSFFGGQEEVQDFASWLQTLNFKHKIVVPGNHEASFDDLCYRGRRVVIFNDEKGELERVKQSTARDWLSPYCHLLINQEVVLEDGNRKIKFYGSPYTPTFGDWAFNYSSEQLLECWEKVPLDTDILITHGPPYGILDKCPDSRRVGCKSLLKKIEQIKPKLHVFGHIHHSYGQLHKGSTHYVNAAICGEDYRATNAPVVFSI